MKYRARRYGAYDYHRRWDNQRRIIDLLWKQAVSEAPAFEVHEETFTLVIPPEERRRKPIRRTIYLEPLCPNAATS